MAHNNVIKWNKAGQVGPRPCDWCGETLNNLEKFLHGDCAELERRFYTQLGYDGDSDVKLPAGYNITIV